MFYELDWNDKVLTITLGKVIDESADFSGIDWESADEIIVDFKDVMSFSSYIVGKWVKFVSAIHKPMVYKNCPNFVVDFVCTISEFITFETKIESFELIEHCDKCERDISSIVNLVEMKNDDGSIKDMRSKCKDCGQVTTLIEAFESRLKVLFQIAQ